MEPCCCKPALKGLNKFYPNFRREVNTCEICWSTQIAADFQVSGPGNMAITDNRLVQLIEFETVGQVPKTDRIKLINRL